jgi:phage regulator Rha-like protein
LEILKILKECGELTSAEIAEIADVSTAAIKQSIRRLLKDVSENVEVRTLNDKEKEERYGHKVGCKVFIYFVEFGLLYRLALTRSSPKGA